MRRISAAAASLVLAGQAQAMTPFVAAFRVDGGAREVTALAWREGADVFVDRATLTGLGLRTPEGAGPFRLQDVPGARVAVDEAQAAVTIICAAQCFAPTAIDASARATSPLAAAAPGFFLNTDTSVTYQDGERDLAAAFDFGAFRGGGVLETTWIQAGAPVRLETRWTRDDPDARTRLSLGDALSRGGPGTAPLHFAGVQWGIDFALDPSFVTFPAPSLTGDAAAPSVVDVYIDDSLRYRTRTDGGPFSLENAPVVEGAGVAHVVVTDALGRETTFAQPFYASPSMLRPGLSEYSLSLGALREAFGAKSNDYGDGFASAFYRRGLTPWLTATARGDVGAGLEALGAQASFTHALLGQFDLGLAASQSARGAGAQTMIGWTRLSNRASFSVSADAASADFAVRGEDGPARRFGLALAAGWQDARLGALSLSYARRERDADEASVFSFTYAPRVAADSDLAFTLLIAEGESRLVSFGLTLTRRTEDGDARTLALLREGGALSARAEARGGSLDVGALSWRVGVSEGARDRIDAAFAAATDVGEARFEVSRVDQQTGLRGRYAFGVALLDGRGFLARPLQDAFALVSVGAPGVNVWHDGRSIGRTDAHGVLLAPSLRAYQDNRLSVDINELPANADVGGDAVVVRPRARQGVVAAFPIRLAAASAARIVDEDGAPLPLGAVLIDGDGARFPVGADGRISLLDWGGAGALQRLGGDYCLVRVSRDALAAQAPLICRATP